MPGCRADNWREVMHDPSVLAADIRAYLEAENAYAEAAMADVEDLRLTLFGEMRGRIKEDDSSVPAPDGDYAYAIRFEEGGEHPLMVRTRRDGSDETGAARRQCHVARAWPISASATSATAPTTGCWPIRWTTRARSISPSTSATRETGEDLADRIEGTTGDAVWAADGKTFFYVWVDENHRPAQVFRHVVGTEQSDDVVVYEDHASRLLHRHRQDPVAAASSPSRPTTTRPRKSACSTPTGRRARRA